MKREPPTPENEPWTKEPWTQHEINLLHKMVQDYDRAQWLKRQIWKWGVWVLGLPASVLIVWEPLARLWKLLRGV